MATKVKSEEAAAVIDMIHDEDKIATRCPKCNRETEVRGLEWPDLEAVIDGIERVPIIERMCANCSYRAGQKGKTMTDAQKEYRKTYNKKRQDRIKAALELLAEQENGTSENDDAEDMTDGEDTDE